jgi:hypothetical protein
MAAVHGSFVIALVRRNAIWAAGKYANIPQLPGSTQVIEN